MATESKRNFTQASMEIDLDSRLIPDGKYRQATNISVSRSENSDVGAIENVLGNKSLGDLPSSRFSTPFKTGSEYITIGTAVDELEDRIYWFFVGPLTEGIYELDISPNFDVPERIGSDDNSSITERNPAYGTPKNTVNRILEFKRSLRIFNFNTANLVDARITNGLLFFTDGKNPLRKINIERFRGSGNYYSYAEGGWEKGVSTKVDKGAMNAVLISDIDPTYDSSGIELTSLRTDLFTTIGSTVGTGDLFNLAKAPSIFPPRVEQPMETREPSANDYISNKFLYFATRRVYRDGEVTALSPFSAPAFYPKRFDLERDPVSLTSMTNQYSEVDVVFDVGGSEVTEIEIVATEGPGRPVYIIGTVNKANLGILSSTPNEIVTHKFRYDNNKAYIVLPENQITRIYDDVPLTAKSVEIVDNRLVYGNYTRDYPLTSVNEDGNLIVPDFDASYNSIVRSPDTRASCSVKSNRQYELGIVYLDGDGRQSAVLQSANGTVTVPFNDPADGGIATHTNRNLFNIRVNSQAPYWARYYRFYVKESRNEFYNIFPKDVIKDRSNNPIRAYVRLDAADINKISASTRLSLKGTGDNIQSTLRQYRVDVYGGEELGFTNDINITNFDVPFEVAQRDTNNGFAAQERVEKKVFLTPSDSDNKIYPIADLPEEFSRLSVIDIISGTELVPPARYELSDDNSVIFAQARTESVCVRYEYYAVPEDAPERNDFYIAVIPDENSDLTPFSNYEIRGEERYAVSDTGTIWETIPEIQALDQEIFYVHGQTLRCFNGSHTNSEVEVVRPGDKVQELYISGDTLPAGKSIGDPVSGVNGYVDVTLNWFNCFSYTSGVEETHIRGEFNNNSFVNGIQASFADSEYRRRNQINHLIHSGIFNDDSSLNRFNEFNRSSAIEFELDLSNGSIQKILSWGGDLMVFQEDQISRIPINENIIQTSDGGQLGTADSRFFGTPREYDDRYGVSTNPESVTSYGNRIYLADKNRGALLRLSQDGITEISKKGVNSYTRREIREAGLIVGIYDDYNDQMNFVFKERALQPVIGDNRGSHTISTSGCLDPRGECNVVLNPLTTRDDDEVQTTTVFSVLADPILGLQRNDTLFVDSARVNPFVSQWRWHLLIQPAVGTVGTTGYVPPNNVIVQINPEGLVVDIEDNCLVNRPPDTPRELFAISNETFNNKFDACANGIVDGVAYHSGSGQEPDVEDTIYESAQDIAPIRITGWKIITQGSEKFVIYLDNGTVEMKESCIEISLGRSSVLGSFPVLLPKGLGRAARNSQLCIASFAESLYWFNSIGDKELPELNDELFANNNNADLGVIKWRTGLTIRTNEYVSHLGNFWKATADHTTATTNTPGLGVTQWTAMNDFDLFIVFNNGYVVQLNADSRVILYGYCAQELCFNSPNDILVNGSDGTIATATTGTSFAVSGLGADLVSGTYNIAYLASDVLQEATGAVYTRTGANTGTLVLTASTTVAAGTSIRLNRPNQFEFQYDPQAVMYQITTSGNTLTTITEEAPILFGTIEYNVQGVSRYPDQGQFRLNYELADGTLSYSTLIDHSNTRDVLNGEVIDPIRIEPNEIVTLPTPTGPSYTNEGNVNVNLTQFCFRTAGNTDYIGLGETPPRSPSVAIVSSSGTSVVIGTPLTLTAVANDPDGDVVSHRWNVPSGVTVTGNLTDASIVVSSGTTGIRTISVTVLDDNSLSATDVEDINWHASNVVPPVPVIVPSIDEVLDVDTPLTLSYRLIGTDTIASVAWGIAGNLPNGLVLDAGSSTTLTDNSIRVNSQSAGEYNVLLTVVDSDGNTGTSRYTVRYQDPIVIPEEIIPVKPIVTIDADSRVVTQGTSITLTANASDSDGTIESYYWDVPDALTVTGSLTNRVIILSSSSAYRAVGNNAVTVRVVDNNFLEGSDTTPLIWTATGADVPPEPTIVATPSVNNNVDQVVTLTYTPGLTTGATVSSQIWALPAGLTIDPTFVGALTDASIRVISTTSGEYSVGLTVTDSNTEVGVDNITLNYNDVAAPVNVDVINLGYAAVSSAVLADSAVPTFCGGAGSGTTVADIVYYNADLPIRQYFDNSALTIPWSTDKTAGNWGVGDLTSDVLPSAEGGIVAARVENIALNGTVLDASVFQCTVPHSLQLGYTNNATSVQERMNACDIGISFGTASPSNQLMTIYADQPRGNFSSIDSNPVTLLRRRSSSGSFIPVQNGVWTDGVVSRLATNGFLGPNIAPGCQLTVNATLTVVNSVTNDNVSFVFNPSTTSQSTITRVGDFGNAIDIRVTAIPDAGFRFAAGGQPQFRVTNTQTSAVIQAQTSGSQYAWTGDTYGMNDIGQTVEFFGTTEPNPDPDYSATLNVDPRITDAEGDASDSFTLVFTPTNTAVGARSQTVDELENGDAYSISATIRAIGNRVFNTLTASNLPITLIRNSASQIIGGTITMTQSINPISNDNEVSSNVITGQFTGDEPRQRYEVTLRSTTNDSNTTLGRAATQTVGGFLDDTEELSQSLRANTGYRIVDVNENVNYTLPITFGRGRFTGASTFIDLDYDADAQHFEHSVWVADSDNIPADGATLLIAVCKADRDKETIYTDSPSFSNSTRLFTGAKVNTLINEETYLRTAPVDIRIWNGTSFVEDRCPPADDLQRLEMNYGDESNVACGISQSIEFATRMNANFYIFRKTNLFNNSEPPVISNYSANYSVIRGAQSLLAPSFSTATGDFTVPESGYYTFDLDMEWSNMSYAAEDGNNFMEISVGFVEDDNGSNTGLTRISVNGSSFVPFILPNGSDTHNVKIGSGSTIARRRGRLAADISSGDRTATTSDFNNNFGQATVSRYFNQGERYRLRFWLRNAQTLRSDSQNFNGSLQATLCYRMTPVSGEISREQVFVYTDSNDISQITALRAVSDNAVATGSSNSRLLPQDGFYSLNDRVIEVEEGRVVSLAVSCGGSSITSTPAEGRGNRPLPIPTTITDNIADDSSVINTGPDPVVVNEPVRTPVVNVVNTQETTSSVSAAANLGRTSTESNNVIDSGTIEVSDDGAVVMIENVVSGTSNPGNRVTSEVAITNTADDSEVVRHTTVVDATTDTRSPLAQGVTGLDELEDFGNSNNAGGWETGSTTLTTSGIGGTTPNPYANPGSGSTNSINDSGGAARSSSGISLGAGSYTYEIRNTFTGTADSSASYVNSLNIF